MRATVLSRAFLCAGVAWLVGCSAQGHPCFNDRVMYADNTTACNYGRSYRCDDGDWIAYRKPCSETSPPLVEPLAMGGAGSCEYGGISYSPGSARCYSGLQYMCDDNQWRALNLPCALGDAPYPVRRGGAVCAYRGITVASSSTICQSGSTFLCNDGAWVGLGTTCR